MHAGKLAALGELAGGIAHELNQPLTVLSGFIALGLSDRDALDAEDLALMSEATLRMSRIVDGVRLFAARTDMHREPIDPMEPARSAAGLRRRRGEISRSPAPRRPGNGRPAARPIAMSEYPRVTRAGNFRIGPTHDSSGGIGADAMTKRASAGLACLLLSLPATAIAADALAGTRDPSEIYGGGPVDTCQWPTAVFVNDCTGTLVHPSVVVFAAHCIAFGGQPSEAKLGENHTQPARSVGVDSCAAHPRWQNVAPGDNASDIAFCRLSTPVEDVPIVPILMGCEADALLPGAPVTLVGFGDADDALGYGPKRSVVTDLQMVGNDAAWIGGGGKSSCYGDSGGPAYIQLDDGSWRVFGATSGSATNDPGCGQTGIWTLIHVYAPWIENTSGIDVTPCHDADGTWNPSEACAAFPMAPGAGGSTWAAGCSGGEQSGIGQTCGPGLGGGESTGGDTGDLSGSSGAGGTGDGGRDTDDDDGETSDGGSEETTDEGTDEGGLVPGVFPPADPFESSCACTNGSPGSAWWLAPILAALRRRRSSKA